MFVVVLNGAAGAAAGADEGEIKKALDGVVSGWFGAEAMKIGATNESETGGEKSGRAREQDKDTARPRRRCSSSCSQPPLSSDLTLKKANDGFVDAVSEHFAMLFVSGMAPLFPAGPAGLGGAREEATARRCLGKEGRDTGRRGRREERQEEDPAPPRLRRPADDAARRRMKRTRRRR